MGFLIFLLNFTLKAVNLYSMLLVAYALLSWFPNAYNTAIGRFLVRICEPYLNLFRRLPLQFFGLDFSVIVGILVLELGSNLIVRIANHLLIGMMY